MKASYLNITASLLIAVTMITACKTDKENSPEDMSETTVVEDNAGTPVDYENTDTESADISASSGSAGATGSDRQSGGGADNASSSNANSQIESRGQTTGTSVNKAQSVEQGAGKPAKGKKSLKGYSAPDGTAAENHDGDQYTKHDTTRMPSGSVPIK